MKIIYFSWLKEVLGFPEEKVTPPTNIKNVESLMKCLSKKSLKHKKIFLNTKNIRFAINHKIVNKKSKVKRKDEIAFFPPFTGG